MKCYLCEREIKGYGNNPEPLAPYGARVCDECDGKYIIPYRLSLLLDLPLDPPADIINAIRFNERRKRNRQCSETTPTT